MRMEVQFLPPSVKYLDDTRCCAEILMISGQLQKCLGGASVQKGIQKLLIGINQSNQFSGNGKDHMKIRCIHDLCLSPVDPDFFKDCLTVRAVAVAIGIIVKIGVATVITGTDITAKFSGLALHQRSCCFCLNFGRRKGSAIVFPGKVKDLLNLGRLIH